MTLLRLVLALLALGLIASIVWALGEDAQSLDALWRDVVSSEPWWIVTLADLYLGFFISAAVIFLAERNKLVAALWALPIFVLGNFWTAAWLIIRAPSLLQRLRG